MYIGHKFVYYQKLFRVTNSSVIISHEFQVKLMSQWMIFFIEICESKLFVYFSMTFYPYLWHGAFDQVGDVVLGISQAGQTVRNLQVLHDQSEAIPQNRTRVLDLLVCYVYPCKFDTTKLAFQKNSQMNCSIPINMMHIVCITVTTSLNNSTGIHLKMFVF